MLRFRVLLPVALLIAAAIVAGVRRSAPIHPCIADGAAAAESGPAPSGSAPPDSLPWHADLHIDAGDNPARSAVRTSSADSPRTADLVVDDREKTGNGGCSVTSAALPIGHPVPIHVVL
jgi:hypothetical protein